jgi:hypothetical protein
MASKHTPSLEHVRATYAQGASHDVELHQHMFREEFDRFLADYRDKIEADAIQGFIRWADQAPAVTWAGRNGLKERLTHPERFLEDKPYGA